ncbi:MAG: heme ABC exporter ATP-binding protein CcmA [Actinobacteria bacterium]|nr:MAG: heme ABC exporter ATP-binding protein CcmA [Actinomycetota bacterium]
MHGPEQGSRKTPVNRAEPPILGCVRRLDGARQVAEAPACAAPERGMLVARRLGKRYGEKRVLRGIDLELPRGGFLVVTGPNGSGKTTLLRICAGLAQPTGGTIERSAVRAQVGYLGHEPLVYRELTALENLELYGRLYRVVERRERIGMLLERFGLWDARHERVASYSRGMTQRLALCRVLLHEPELFVLDEPYSALDEAGAELLDAQLAELRAERTFLLATHEPVRVEPFASGRLALAA